MPSQTRNRISFSHPLPAVLLMVFAFILLAGAAAGEGTVLVDLGDDIMTQEDTSISSLRHLVALPRNGWSESSEYATGAGSSSGPC